MFGELKAVYDQSAIYDVVAKKIIYRVPPSEMILQVVAGVIVLFIPYRTNIAAKITQLVQIKPKKQSAKLSACPICFERKAEKVVYLPCKHAVVCIGCDGKIEPCPLCRAIIIDRFQIFQ